MISLNIGRFPIRVIERKPDTVRDRMTGQRVRVFDKWEASYYDPESGQTHKQLLIMERFELPVLVRMWDGVHYHRQSVSEPAFRVHYRRVGY